MSFWVYRKGTSGRRSLYLLDLPWELVFLLISVVIVLIVLVMRRLGLIP